MLCPECNHEFQQPGYRFCPYDGSRLLHPSRRWGGEAAEADVGRVVAGRYTLRRFLARGAMARIFMADDERDDRLVAVKLMDVKRVKDAEARTRFLREAEAVRGVHHENVVTILDVGQEDETPYIVMEFLRGESLGERFQVAPRLPLDLALSVATQVCDALWAVHQKGIVHRDLKPDNIYLLGDPIAPGGVRLLDFGLSRIFESKLTKAGTVIGTPGYMAPEQVVADPVDQRTDLYGLGMILYRMVVGRLPFDEEDDVKMIARQLLSHPPPPSHFVSDVDAAVASVIMTAVSKRPEQRYPNAQIMGADLRKLVRGEGGLFARPEAAERKLADADRYELTTALAREVAKGYRGLLHER